MTFRPSIVVAAGDVGAGSVVAVAVSGVAAAVAVAVVSVTPILKTQSQVWMPVKVVAMCCSVSVADVQQQPQQH